MRALSFVLVLLFGAPGFADDGWSDSSARTMEKGRWEVGVFAPLRYGLTSKVQLSTHPLLSLVAPNGEVKVNWSDDGKAVITSAHRFFVPTGLYRLMAREGTGGVLPSTSQVPWIVHLENEIRLSRRLASTGRFLTTAVGASVAPRFGESSFPNIDLPFVYPRTAVYQSDVTGFAEVRFEGRLYHRFFFAVGGTAFFLPGTRTFVAEQTSTLSWQNDGLRVSAGVVASSGRYPFGFQTDVWPLIDVEFAW